MLKDLLVKLWQELDIPGSLPKSRDSVYIVPIEEGLEIVCKDLGREGYQLFTSVVRVPEGNCEELFITLMHANLFGEATGGAVLGMDYEGEDIILSQKVSYGCSYKEFEYVIEDFCNWVEFWREEALEQVKQRAKPFL